MAHADLEEIETPDFLDLKARAEKYFYADWNGFGYILDQAVSIIGQIFLFAGVVAIMFTLNPIVVAVFIALVIISTIIESWAKKKSIDISMKQIEVERREMYLTDLFENFKYGKEIRIGVLTDWLLDRLKIHHQTTSAYYKEQNKYNFRAQSANTITDAVQQIISYLYIISQVLKGFIGIGDFTMYIGTVATFSKAMRDVMSNIVSIRRYQPYFDAAMQYLKVPSTLRSSGNDRMISAPFTIEFRNVSYKYKGQENFALKNINLVLSYGQRLALVGENGSGKSTFVKLLTRQYDPTEGEILVNGIDIKSFSYDEYMKAFSVVFQDFQLFSFSLAENIALAVDEHGINTDEKMDKAVRGSGLDSKVSQLKNGLDSTVYKTFDEEGFEPSGGEAQKIALARALYRNAPVVILDEPTAALDPRAESDLYMQFDSLIENKTAVYISHRLSSCQFCDYIAVLENGEMREVGTHDDLLAKNGLYADLFNLQAKYYTSERGN